MALTLCVDAIASISVPTSVHARAVQRPQSGRRPSMKVPSYVHDGAVSVSHMDQCTLGAGGGAPLAVTGAAFCVCSSSDAPPNLRPLRPEHRDLASGRPPDLSSGRLLAPAAIPTSRSMFVVTEADAAAIREIFEQEGELSAGIEVRRRFPGITDNARAREQARTIAGWRPVSEPRTPVSWLHPGKG